jgi:hypothetical protein
MSNDRSRSSTAGRRESFQVEGLEERSLMSGLAPHQRYFQMLGIGTPSNFVSQQVSALDVTLTRSGLESLLNQPLTVNFSASLGSTTVGAQPTAQLASASDTFTPVNESITFPAGVTTETVRIPVNSGAANPGSVRIALSVSSSTPGVMGGVDRVYLVAGPADLPPIPPSITNAHLVFQGTKAVAFAITFNTAMSPKSVENLHDYVVTTGTNGITPGSLVSWLTFNGTETRVTVPLKGAHYDPATYTVTLFPTHPLKTSVLYGITRATPLPKDAFIDLQGTKVAFQSFGLKGHSQVNWPDGAPPTLYTGN